MNTKRFSAWADLGVMAAIFLGAMLVAGIIMAAVMLATGETTPRGPVLFFSYSAHFLLAVIGGILWLRHRGGVRLRFGVGWADGPMILAGLVVITAAGIVMEPLINFFPESYLEKLNETIGRGGWTIVTTVVAAPILEEILFRGLVLETLARRWRARWAVLASAALFGLAHAPILPQMVNAFVIAVVMGYLYLRTRSLIPVIVIHAVNNGLAYMLLVLTGTQATDTREMIGNDTLWWIVYAASAVVLVGSLIVLDRNVRTKTGENPLNEETTDE